MALQCSGLAVVNNSNLSRCSSQVIHHITRGPPDSPGSLRNSKLEFYQISQSEVAGGPAGPHCGLRTRQIQGALPVQHGQPPQLLHLQADRHGRSQ